MRHAPLQEKWIALPGNASFSMQYAQTQVISSVIRPPMGQIFQESVCSLDVEMLRIIVLCHRTNVFLRPFLIMVTYGIEQVGVAKDSSYVLRRTSPPSRKACRIPLARGALQSLLDCESMDPHVYEIVRESKLSATTGNIRLQRGAGLVTYAAEPNAF